MTPSLNATVKCDDCGRPMEVENWTVGAWYQCSECHRERPFISINSTTGERHYDADPAAFRGRLFFWVPSPDGNHVSIYTRDDRRVFVTERDTREDRAYAQLATESMDRIPGLIEALQQAHKEIDRLRAIQPNYFEWLERWMLAYERETGGKEARTFQSWMYQQPMSGG